MRCWAHSQLLTRWLILLLLNTHLFLYCSARDFITIDNPLPDGQTLVSAGKRFELGFFTPSMNYARYIGIWYRWDPKTVVWVANRDKPLYFRIGTVLGIENGTLNLVDAKKNSYWSCKGTESSLSTNITITAQLLDSGNLVLREANGGTMKTLWQSFEEPTDTFLPGMMMGKSLELVSWNGTHNPARGIFIFSKDEDHEDGYVIQNGHVRHWTSKGHIPPDDRISAAVYHLSSKKDSIPRPKYPKTSIDLIFNINMTRLVMNITGEIQYWKWDDKTRWTLISLEPRNPCSFFDACGSFAICNWKRNPMCTCLEGFTPASLLHLADDYSSNGCVAESTSCDSKRFLELGNMRVGNSEPQFKVTSKAECRKECKCKCQAYSYSEDRQSDRRKRSNPNGGGMCRIWREALTNLQEEYIGGCNLSVRKPITHKVESSGGSKPISNDLSTRPSQLVMIVLITVISVSSFTCAAGVYIWRKNVTHAEVGRNPSVHRFDSERHAKDLIETDEFKEEDKKGIDVPFFEFQTILAATHNFSDANKLGQGGYGPVYKGTFPGGQEIAVKRLSSVSGQGLHEFKNEVVLIAKLQHRNLVKLWGYCVKGHEKILIYEYMPNRSLDAFIFDSELASSLNWSMRYNIILGVARGLLYLHQDSRLRIIHRDMKTSNILLDGEMNPKISDFGLARIFGGKQDEANTNRVVGTYGYMAPEYALDGFFSVKSDVFSFGVVMLEIISGKRTTGFYRSQETLSLLGYAWRFWEEDDALKLMDHTLIESCNRSEFIKCVHVGLLCVQEEANDRPDMAGVIMMLGSESASLPSPKQPAFIARAGPSSSGIASSSTGSITEIKSASTSGLVDGR